MSAFAFADAALAGSAVGAMLDAYGMYHGVGTIYSVSSSSGVGDSFTALWDEFNEFQTHNNESTYDILDVYHHMQGVVGSQPVVDSFTHSSGKFSGFYIDQESAAIFDKFWNWLLSGPAEMTVVDNQWAWNYDNSVVVSPVVVSSDLFPLIPVTGSTSSDLLSSGLFVFESSYSLMKGSTYVGSSFSDCFVALVYENSNAWIYRLIPSDSSVSSGSVYIFSSQFGGVNSTSVSNFSRDSSTGIRYSLYGAPPVSSLSSVNSSIPVFSSARDCLDAFANRSALSSSVSLSPYGGSDYDPSSDPPPPITIPVISASDYIPSAVEIVTDIPWDDDRYGDVFPLPDLQFSNFVNDLADAISASDFALLDDPNPSDPDAPPPAAEIFSPLLPVSPPSFDFNFAGIWHYVVTWVQSLGSWFSTMFAVWAALPYAMVVPVYATAVVVIVLGVYKRFFM